MKEIHYLDSISSKKVWLGKTLKEAREQEINLGLDLKGGMNVVLELNVGDVLRSLSDNNRDENFNKAIDLAYERQVTSQKDFIDLFAEEYNRLDPGARLSAIFSTFDLKDKINSQSTDGQVITVLKGEVKSAIDNSFRVLRTRIDRFGVVAPNIQRLETAGRILVELPGVKEPERVRKLLQGSANLEFWETYNLPEIYQQLVNADQVLAKILRETDDVAEEAKGEVTEETKAKEEKKEEVANAVSEADSLIQKLSDQSEDAKMAMDREAFEKEHPLFALLQISQYNGQLSPGSVVGYALSTNMNKIDEYLSMKAVKEVLPRNLTFKWAVKAMDEQGMFFELYAIKVTNRDGSPALGGDVVTDARDDFKQEAGMSIPEVSMTMNAEGAKAWARLTKDNIGRQVAIILDGMVYSAPRVNDEITGGRSSITGQFSAQETKDLANVLKTGKMAASVRIVQEDVVGPSLGKQAISAGVISFIIALVLLMIYMCLAYGIIPGLIVNGALILNIFFTLGVLSSFHAVLTLSGIAGMVLTLGMAVDANVLVYERTKEELRSGKNLARSISDGYSNAFSAIFDSNLTTVITAIVLFYFGTGPIRGFATTLMIGLGASFLTAVFLTRIVYEALLKRDKLKNVTFTTSITRNLLTEPKFDFLGNRKKGYIIPVAIIVLGAIFLGTVGLNNGIDFTGGRNYIVKFDQPVQTAEVRDMLDNELDGAVSVITIGTSNQVRISTNYRILDNGEGVDRDIENRIFKGIQSLLPEGTTMREFIDNYVQSSQKVGPSMADDIKRAAVFAVLIAMVFMALYILLRFREWSFSVGVFVSVTVNTLAIVAFYAIFWKILPFSMEIDQTFIAAILTIIGYSINDTVVVFDRIRETIKLYPNRKRYDVINYALNSTLARTFNTSLTTLVVVLSIFLLGGNTIRSFTFAILLGIIFGTYSTLFVATPIAYEMQRRKKDVE